MSDFQSIVKWYSVEEKLPEMGNKRYCSESVLVYVKCNNGVCFTDIGVFDFHGYWYDYGDEYGSHVTHWAELPEPPKEEEEGS